MLYLIKRNGGLILGMSGFVVYLIGWIGSVIFGNVPQLKGVAIGVAAWFVWFLILLIVVKVKYGEWLWE